MKRFFACILISIFIFMSFFTTSVHAASYTCERFPNNLIITPEIYDNAKYHVIYVYWSGYWASARLFFSDEPLKIVIRYSNNVYNGISITSTSSSQSIRYCEGYKEKGWDFSNVTEFNYGGITTSLPAGLNNSKEFPTEIKNYLADSNCDVYDGKTNEIVYPGQPEPEFISPEIQNKDKISKLDFDSMAIFLNDYDSKERLYLHRLEVATTVDLGDGNTVYYYNDKVFGLDFFTSYYNNDPDHPGYTIPKYQFELENNKIYYFLLSSSATSLDHSYNLIDYTKIENAYDGLGVSTSDSFTYEQLQQEQQKKQNDQLEENNKTNKNIFETIKEMLSYLNPFSDNFILLKLWDFLGTLISYINPFSDNFLGKKIVELIGNLLKSLFVPSDEYFNNFFSDLKQWFSDRFGLLFYPFELIIDILNRITNINLSEPKFNIPEIKEPSTGKILFKAQNYNFNDLLDTNEFKIMHDIYFVIVDAIIIFALANLIKSKLKEVETE